MLPVLVYVKYILTHACTVDVAFILPQAALLYTNLKGERRLRVHNMALNCSTKYQDIYRSCEMDTLVNYFSKSSELDHPFSDISVRFF